MAKELRAQPKKREDRSGVSKRFTQLRRRFASRRHMSDGMRKRLLGGAVGLGTVACLGVGSIWAVSQGYDARIVAGYQSSLNWVTAMAGLRVKEVYVVGRKATDLQDVARAVDIRRGDNILNFDADAARDRLLELGWVKQARVIRQLPDTITVTLVEREPLALWQRQGKLALIGRDGSLITARGLSEFGRLPLVVGKGSRKHANSLLTMLAGQPSLYPHVEAAMRLADRRWNLRMRNGVTINLPVKDAASAWAKLAEIEAKHGIFKREVSEIDLRLPDRLVVRMTPRGILKKRKNGKDT